MSRYSTAALGTPGLAGEGETAVGTDEVTEAVLAELAS